MPEVEYPLVSFVLVTYNQEQFIKEAVDSAFSQTYSPLEIILSDDCSNDNTYKIMAEMVSAYNGPHKITLRRNKKNLGIVAHFSRCIELCNGEFVVGGAGDDISLSERVTLMFQAWINSGKTVSSLFSNSVIIDENGVESDLWFTSVPPYTKNIDEFKINRRSWVTGCSHAFNKSIFTKYGRIHPSIIQEDGVLSFRALLEGGILYVDKVLVKYRRHSNNVYSIEDPIKKIILQKKEHAMKKSWLYDAERSDLKDEQLIGILRQEYIKSLLKMWLYSIPQVGGLVEKLLCSLRNIRNSYRIWSRRLSN